MKRILSLLSVLLIFMNAQNVYSQDPVSSEINGNIQGHISTTDQKPAAEVTIQLKGQNIYTLTDEHGYFILKNIKAGSYVLVISNTGLQTIEETIHLTNNETIDLNFTLTETAKQLETVIVNSNLNFIKRKASADKAGLALMDLPQSMGVVSNKIITDQQANRLGDIVKNVSGVSLTQQRQGVAETFSARGYSIGVSGTGGSIFKNGIISNSMGFPEASALESVEVLKGSSALLYGNTSGGVIINMVTKKPKFTKAGEVSMRMGSNQFFKPTVDVYGPVSQKIAYRLVATHENSDSYRDVVKTNRTYINPSLLYKINNKTSLLLQGDYLHANFTPDNGIGILNQNMDAVIPPSRSRFINFSWANYLLHQTSGSITADHTINDRWKINFIAAAQGTKVEAYGSTVPNAIASNGDYARTLNKQKTSEHNYTSQLNLVGEVNTFNVKHNLLIGTDLVRVVTISNTYRYFTNGVLVSTAYDKINILDPTKFVARQDIPQAEDTARTTSPSNRLGIYFQDLISLSNKIKILAGIRWSHINTFQTSIFNNINQTERKGTAANALSEAFSPKLAFIYQPLKTTSIYASYTNNFTANTGVDIYGTQMKPSLTDQFEFGVKNELLKGRLSANLSVYHIINHNFAQMAQYKADGSINSDANVKELSGETTSDGFEIDMNAVISKNIYFIAGYGNNYMRYTKTSGIKGSNIEGEKLINNPDHTINATAFYTFTRSTLKGLKIGFATFYTGQRMGGIQNTNGQTPVYNRQITLSDFTTFDISAGYSFKKVSVQAKISNITNTLNYLAHDRYSINPIAPRQFATTISYKF